MRGGTDVGDPLVALLTRVALALRVSSAVFVTAAALLSVTADHLVPTVVTLLVYDAIAVVYGLKARTLPAPLVFADLLLVTGVIEAHEIALLHGAQIVARFEVSNSVPHRLLVLLEIGPGIGIGLGLDQPIALRRCHARDSNRGRGR